MPSVAELIRSLQRVEWLKKPVNLFVVGLFVGSLTILALRVILAQDHTAHHHANFGIFIDGKRQKFESPLYYEEVTSCSQEGKNDPKHRAHMHDMIGHVVHVHEAGATWGQFFANIGWGLSSKSIQTDKGVLVDGQNDKELNFLLNGKPIDSVANKVIRSEDVLFIDYGNGENLQAENQQIERDAQEYNKRNDPSSCSGGEPLTFKERLKRAFDFTN